jgi:predicted unusual protein kinase regulating ubiquinone biosynthesis (AarF/ABC1/UbiB family)
MALSLRPEQLRRYKDVAMLLVKYGRNDIVRMPGDTVDLTETSTTDDEAVTRDAEALAAELESLGPTFVKLGQLLSKGSDFLPPAYTSALSRLQDDVEALPYEVVAGVVEAELGFRIAKGFAEFDPEPLAAASLGQVHRARMRDGREVAVKVQRPDIRTRIVDDLEAISQLAAFADRHTETGKRFGLETMVEEFRTSMLHELDYLREASNLQLLGRNLAGMERIVVPQPIEDYTTGRVLTMEYVGGRKVTAIGPLGRMDVDGRGLAQALFSSYLKQILDDGFFHADPHPGNVHVTDDGRLALIDLGMVARLTPQMQDRIARLLLAIGDGNGAEAADIALGLGIRRDDVPVDEETYRRRVTTLITEQQGLTLGDMAPGAVVAELSRISGECGLRPVPELTMLGKALLNLDEVARHLDPEFAPEETIRDEVSSILRRRLFESASPARLFSAAMDAKDFAEKLPGRVNKVFDALAEGELTVNVNGIDESELMRGFQRLANRITTGLVLAALIVGAAMLMRVETSSRLFGYPALAIVCFLLAAAGGFALLVTILWSDRRRG